MTVQSLTDSVSYTLTGILTPLPVTFRFLESADLRVVHAPISGSTPVELVLNTDYTVTGARTQGGGSVTLLIAISAGDVVNIDRGNMSRTQLIDYRANDPFPEEDAEDGLDRLTMLLQQTGIDGGRRSLTLFATDPDGGGRYDAKNNRIVNLDAGVNLTDAATVGQIGPGDATLRPDLASTDGSGLVGFLQFGTGAVPRTVQAKAREQYASPLDFGGVGDGVTDDTAAIVAMCASGAKRFDFLDKSWMVTMANNAALVTFNAVSGIKIRGAGAEIYDPRVYTGDPIAPVFDFVGCSDVESAGLNYRGAVLASPSTDLGYLGGTFIRFRNGSSNLTVDAEIRHARYGVLSGSYADETQGACKDFNLRLKTSFCGYPVAVYYADAVKADIYAEDVHRAAYLAGVDGGDVCVQWRNQYIADMVVLLTDAKTGTGAQRGCRDLNIASYDLGSTVFQESSACCGLGNSRVGPVTIHENLSFDFRVKSTDTVSTKVSGFKLASGALPGGEPFFWEPEVILRNFKISGIIDRTGQTLDSNAAGDIYWFSNDSGVHVATVSNISFDGVTIIPSSGTTRNCYFVASGLTDQVTFNRFTSAGAVGLTLGTSTNAKAHFENSTFPAITNVGTTGPIHMRGSTIGTVPDVMTANGVFGGAIDTNGGGLRLRMKQVTVALTSASVNWSAGIPQNAMVVGLTSRIQADITGATGYQIGISGDLSRYANVNNLLAGLTTGASNYAATELAPRVYQANTTVVVTAKTSNFTGGTLKMNLYYFDLSPPTS